MQIKGSLIRGDSYLVFKRRQETAQPAVGFFHVLELSRFYYTRALSLGLDAHCVLSVVTCTAPDGSIS